MAGQLRAIETTYKGYRFRSRLEARWAVFFDALGLRWRYEAEGFDVGHWYLPDFEVDGELDGEGGFVEIKPRSGPGAASEATYSALTALAERTGRKAILVNGDPWPDEYYLNIWRPVGPAHEYDAERPGWEFADCRKCDGVGLYCEDYGESSWICRHSPGVCCHCDAERWMGTVPRGDRVMAAFEAARSARFEHGEKPYQRPRYAMVGGKIVLDNPDAPEWRTVPLPPI